MLDRNGSGTFADVIAGIDWAAANGMSVVNMSLGASVGSNGLKSACDNAFAALLWSTGNFTTPAGVRDQLDNTANTTASITGGGGADVVTITKAQYDSRKQKLTVEAVSDDLSATLTVVGFGTMSFDSKKGIWKLKKSGVGSAPATVTVTSDLGGSDTAPVQVK